MDSPSMVDNSATTSTSMTTTTSTMTTTSKDPALPGALKHAPGRLRRILVELLRVYKRRRSGVECEFNAGEWMQSCLERNPWSNVMETTEEEVEQAKRMFREASSSSLFDRYCEMAEQERGEKEVSTQPRPSAEKVSTQPRPNAEEECVYGGRDIRTKSKYVKVKAEVGESEIWKEAQRCKVEVRAVEEEFKYSGQSGTEVPVTFSDSKKLVPGLKLGKQDTMQLQGKAWQGKDWKEAQVKVGKVVEEMKAKVEVRKNEQHAKGWGGMFRWPKGKTQQFPKKVKEPKTKKGEEKVEVKVEVKKAKKVKQVKRVKLGDKIPEEMQEKEEKEEKEENFKKEKEEKVPTQPRPNAEDSAQPKQKTSCTTSPPVVDLATMATAIKQRCKGCFVSHTPGRFCNKKKVQPKHLKSNIRVYKATKKELQAILARINMLEGKKEQEEQPNDCVLCSKEQVHICKEDLMLAGKKEQEVMATRLPRRRGGADIPEEVRLESLRMARSSMVQTAIAVAAYHNIRVHPSIPNMASGNCAFESCIDQINVSRSREFSNTGQLPDHTALRYQVQKFLFQDIF